MICIDARGLACPEPVILTKRALKENLQPIEILVNNESSKLNVERFLLTYGYDILIEKLSETEYRIRATKRP